jgi:hypothetical protein
MGQFTIGGSLSCNVETPFPGFQGLDVGFELTQQQKGRVVGPIAWFGTNEGVVCAANATVPWTTTVPGGFGFRPGPLRVVVHLFECDAFGNCDNGGGVFSVELRLSK